MLSWKYLPRWFLEIFQRNCFHNKYLLVLKATECPLQHCKVFEQISYFSRKTLWGCEINGSVYILGMDSVLLNGYNLETIENFLVTTSCIYVDPFQFSNNRTSRISIWIFFRFWFCRVTLMSHQNAKLSFGR